MVGSKCQDTQQAIPSSWGEHPVAVDDVIAKMLLTSKCNNLVAQSLLGKCQWQNQAKSLVFRSLFSTQELVRADTVFVYKDKYCFYFLIKKN